MVKCLIYPFIAYHLCFYRLPRKTQRKTDISCQGNMANWDIEIFTFLSPYGFLGMVVHTHVIHDMYDVVLHNCNIYLVLLLFRLPIDNVDYRQYFLTYPIIYKLQHSINTIYQKFYIQKLSNYSFK